MPNVLYLLLPNTSSSPQGYGAGECALSRYGAYPYDIPAQTRNEGKSHALLKRPQGILTTAYKNKSAVREANGIDIKKAANRNSSRRSGDPDGNRTRVTAVKGRCLNRLTTGPYNFSGELFLRGLPAENGSGNWIRTNDTPGMNRML